MKLPHRRQFLHLKLRRRHFLHLAAGAAALLVVSRAAGAEAYPTRPITIIVPFPAGGPVDTVGRILAERMRTALGQPVVIENVSGAGGSIGIARVARMAGDGYTLSIGNWASHVGASVTYPVRYDVLKDFEPVALLAAEPQIIVAKKTLPVSDLKGLIAWLRANRDKATSGTAGVGSAAHVAGVFFEKQTGTDFQFVPYRGAAPAVQALVAGEVDFEFALGAASLPQVHAGTIKALAVANRTRLPAAPEVPTVDEAGLPGFYFSVWTGLWAPNGTSKEIVARLNTAIVEALADPNVRQRFADIGQEIPPRDQQTPEALGIFHNAETAKWWPIIKAAGIKPE